MQVEICRFCKRLEATPIAAGGLEVKNGSRTAEQIYEKIFRGAPFCGNYPFF